MTLEALTSSELSSFIVYDTISATSHHHHHHHHQLYANPSHGAFYPVDNEENLEPATGYAAAVADSPGMEQPNGRPSSSSTAAQGRKKRRRRPRSCKNKEEAESQRMTHIAVERNRRRQMNEHLAVLRSLMPESYIQRGDQASIVAGAIDFVKELEQLLQSLEAQKMTLQQQRRRACGSSDAEDGGVVTGDGDPRRSRNSSPILSTSGATGQGRHRRRRRRATDCRWDLRQPSDTLPRRPGQLLKMVAGFQTLHLTVLHLSVTTMDTLVLYSVSAKVEEGCNLTSVDDIAAAVHHMLTLIEAEAALA
ncbi:unnamed protein product [Spirodela intermedia]|uniref:BHLH domain-containing protein n=1 Tax=Spirodela intermedia TaxID=51605 RepID=A0A7I8JJR6_SPIIN|nr:unnamed protein product [Spirodela intermedia]CAA6669672.1 unnamed protein product [Spirodela intermedia]